MDNNVDNEIVEELPVIDVEYIEVDEIVMKILFDIDNIITNE
jgi:hypothetical protein